MKIYLIRHGETDWNLERRLQGGVDIPLNEKGLELARVTAKGLRDIHFDVIYTSPLQRAKQTALAIAEGRQVPVIDDDRIREICFGPFEGLICAKENYNIPDPEFMNFFLKPHLYIPPQGGESVKQLCDRTADFMEWLTTREELKDSTVLVSAHGAAVKGLLNGVRRINRKLQGDEGPEDLSAFWGKGVHRNCAVTILDSDEKGIRILEEDIIFYDPSLSENYFDKK